MRDFKYIIKKIYDKLYKSYYRKRMGACGENVEFSPFDSVFGMKLCMLDQTLI